MAQVVQLRSGDNFPSSGNYLVVDRTARGRAFDYFIEASPPLHAELGARLPADEPGFASLETALAAAQALAERHGVETIYVRQQTVIVRPFYPGAVKPV